MKLTSVTLILAIVAVAAAKPYDERQQVIVNRPLGSPLSQFLDAFNRPPRPSKPQEQAVPAVEYPKPVAVAAENLRPTEVQQQQVISSIGSWANEHLRPQVPVDTFNGKVVPTPKYPAGFHQQNAI